MSHRLFFFLLCVLGSLIHAQNSVSDQWWAQEGPKWQDARLEAQRLVFPPGFIDSVRRERGIEFTPGTPTVSLAGFRSGETLVFDVGWGPVRAGLGIMTITPDSSAAVFTVTAEAVTNDFFSTFYKVRDFVRSDIRASNLCPFFFEEHLREGRYKADRWILFDHQGLQAFTHKKGDEPVEIPQNTHSLASLLYFIRSLDLNRADTFSVNCFVQKKNYRVLFRRDRVESIKTELGTFECIPIEPLLIGKGRVFTEKDKIRIWLTNDRRRLPVLIKSKIALGSITVRLIAFDHRAQ